jgi:hypothetical protein
MHVFTSLRSTPTACLSSFALLFLAGCSSVGSPSLSLLPTASTAPAEPEGPAVTVELRPHRGKPQRIELAHRDGMLVQEALEEARATQRFHRMELLLVRKNQHDPGEHAMGVAFDDSRRRVPESSNYAVWPSDRIVVEEIRQSALERMLDGVLGPINRITGA